MGSIIVTVPDIPESDLVFDDAETRDILKFFWPGSSAGIDGMAIDTDARRFAQMLLIAAIDASYAMGYIEALFTTVAKPGKSLAGMGKKLARKFVKHWWKHATQKDLTEVKIYDRVREAIASRFRSSLEMRISGVASNAFSFPPFYLAGASDFRSSMVWG